VFATTSSRSRRIVVAVAIALGTLLLGAVSAGAVALHALTHKGCVADVGDLAGCGSVAQGLQGARGVAVSPDGASVYAVAGENAIVSFDRTPDGALSNPSCIADPPDTAGCGSTAQGLDGAFAVAVSPDGASVYAVSNTEDAIVSFDRAADGSLSNPRCIADPPNAAGCGSSAQGLNSVRAVGVSPDGDSVYALGNDDDAIVRFDRAADGTLSNPSCIADPPNTAGCGSTAQGLDAPRAVAISPDGTSLYTAADEDDTVVRFDRAPTGALSNRSCIADVGDAAGCGATAQGLNGAKSIAMSPNGANIYIGSIADHAVVRFDRASNGTLSNPSCIADPPDAAGCGATAQGLEDARGVTVTADGENIYLVAGDDRAIVSFDRAADGALSNPSCIADVGDVAGCGAVAQGLDDPQELASSPDGASVYAVSSTDSALVSFAREEVEPAAPPAGPAGPQGPAATKSPPGSDARVACKRKGKKLKCRVAFTSAAGVTRARLSRRGVTYGSGKTANGPDGKLVLRFWVAEPLPPGRYVLTVIQWIDGARVVTQSRVRVG
jgi:DNA-binding beta-propeller fold protein YncE